MWAERQENDDEVEAGAQFTYIPHNPRKYYRRLLECCLEADLAALRDPTVPDDDQVRSCRSRSYSISKFIEYWVRYRWGSCLRTTSSS